MKNETTIIADSLADAACIEKHNYLDGFGLASNTYYLAKCQVDTPIEVVAQIWSIVKRYRENAGYVLDAGAGDGRFSVGGTYTSYIGYELDSKRIPVKSLPPNATLLRSDAFAIPEPYNFDLAIGNPPYVKHHDLTDEWREHVATWIKDRTGVRPSGWSNAYLYFFWLGLITTKTDGLVVYLVPFDWVTRPAAKTLREYITKSGWKLDIYRFDKEPFEGVLTTACIAVVDKRTSGPVRYFRLTKKSKILPIKSPTLSKKQPLSYQRGIESIYARRGLSPGNQQVFLLTEEERQKNNLRRSIDVVPAINSFKNIETEQLSLTKNFFEKYFVQRGERCWLIVPSDNPSAELLTYLEESKKKCYQNTTCSKREIWWKFTMPQAPQILYASGFRGPRPKSMLNEIGAIAVGAVCGVYSESNALVRHVFDELRQMNFAARVVAMSRGFTKVEINQMNGVIQSSMKTRIRNEKNRVGTTAKPRR